jgi:hypothetical protein
MSTETSREIFLDMRDRIVETLTEDWSTYIGTLTSTYDRAFTDVKTTLGAVQAAIIERKKEQQALMVGVLSAVTGGVVGVFADKLAKEAPALVGLETATLTEVTKAAEKDSVLSQILCDTLKDGIKKGGDKLTELGLDHFKSESPSDGFEPEGVRVAEYQRLLNDGVTNRAKVLTRFAVLLYEMADAFSVELADTIRKGMLTNDFFDQKRSHLTDSKVLRDTAELALWCGWALARDEDYWTKQAALAPALSSSEVFDFNSVRKRIIELGVPKEAVTIDPFRVWKHVGLDVVGFKNWVKSSDMVHTLYDQIPHAEAGAYHFGKIRMQETVRLSFTAA